MTSPASFPSFVDLHNHLVPGVDDGAADVVESLTALRELYAEGVRTLVTTPHLLVPRLATDGAIGRELDLQRRAFDRLMDVVSRQVELPVLGLGQEIWAPDAATLRRVVSRTDVGLDGSPAMLVEFGFELQGTHLDVVAGGGGRRTPDRDRPPGAVHAILPGHEPLDVMRRWRDAGALLQVNAGSFSGYYRDHRPGSDTLAWAMVAEGMVDIIGTRSPRAAAGGCLAARGVRPPCARGANRRRRSGRWSSGRRRCCGTSRWRSRHPAGQDARGRRVVPIACSR